MSKSAKAAPVSDRPESFQIKGGLFPMSLLELKTPNLDDVEHELKDKVAQSPAFFQQSAIVLGFEFLTNDDQDQLDLEALCQLCRALGLVPAAIRGGTERVVAAAKPLGLAVMPKARASKSGTTGALPLEPTPENVVVESLTTETLLQQTKIITAPIRSGQQIYARGSDLIVLSSVSAGAEVLADGNIHIYGALRGRALAGIQGDESARIFCRSQEAELVSIAGQFMVDEMLKDNHWKQPVQIFLEDGRISICAQP